MTNKNLKTHYFLNKKFIIYEGTYIPHFETEYIVVKTEKYISQASTIFEVGTGSACIPILLKQRNKDLSITSIEIEEEVYLNAVHNCVLHNTKITCLNTSLSNIKKISADIVFSNPPYINSEEAKKIAKGDKNIMRNIDGGEDGLDIVREILEKSYDVTYCVIELGYEDQKTILEKEYSSKWKILEYEKPLCNQDVFFCVLKNTRYWT